jgi:hypothetical protein
MQVMRVAGALYATPGWSGQLSTGAAINDPIFWVIHPMFDRAWHVLLLSSKFQSYNLTWVDKGCTGSGWNDELPFEGSWFSDGGSDALLTNAELWDYFHPAAGNVDYVYDQFTVSAPPDLSW